MTTFLLDLWHDLREKRLWPVAVGLLACTAAVPLLLFKPATHPSAGPGAAASAPAESLPVVTIADSSGNVSKLDAFAKHNPFKPLGDAAATPSAGPTPPQPGSSGSGGKSSSGSPGSGGTPGAGGGAPGSAGSGGPSSSVTYFAWHVDVRFGKSGHEKSYKDVSQLSMLPDAQSPLVVFMGMKSDYKTAIFMIDSSKFSADGEGSCKPKPDQCSFVLLKTDDAHNEETLAGIDGSTYTLKLTAVKKVTLSKDQANAVKNATTPTKGKAAAKAAGKDLPSATGGSGKMKAAKHDSTTLFKLPSFASIG